ncbi:hypothetical protein AB1Y20_016795 [Prymnesium parvum]|uniref:Uncharacterized protein n=1 Tax=Prymnesium parvum TaxID=97485 RepID=A0AB34I9X9_PRYPA
MRHRAVAGERAERGERQRLPEVREDRQPQQRVRPSLPQPRALQSSARAPPGGSASGRHTQSARSTWRTPRATSAARAPA